MVRTKEGHFDGFSISVPVNLMPGVVFAFHNRLQHPKKSQLSKFLTRYFYTPAMPEIVEKISNACTQCLATVRLPKALTKETSTLPRGFGTNFAADVLERNGQVIFVCKEILTQFTVALIANDQTVQSMKDAIIQAVSPLINISGAEIRTDSAPAFQSLFNNQHKDQVFQELKLKLTLGDPLNPNKNPVAESTIAELKREILNIVNANQRLSPTSLSLATRNLNNRVRAGGRTALERMTSRDLLTSKEFPLDDEKEIEKLGDRRKYQHEAHEKFRSKTSVNIPTQSFKEGDLVMYRSLPDYNKKRDTFVVVKQDGNLVEIRKMSNQLRMKTYKVKVELLVPVFQNSSCSSQGGLMDDTRPGEMKDHHPDEVAGPFPCQEDPMDDARPGEMKDLNFWEDARQPAVKLKSKSPKSSRRAKARAKMAISEQAMSKLVAIKAEKIKKKKKKNEDNNNNNWVYITFPPPTQFQNPANIQHQHHIDVENQYEGIEDINIIFQFPINHTSDEETSEDSQPDSSDEGNDDEDTEDESGDDPDDDDDTDDAIEDYESPHQDEEDNHESEYESFQSEDRVESSTRAHQAESQTRGLLQRNSSKSSNSVESSIWAHTPGPEAREVLSDSSLITMTSTARRSLTRRFLDSKLEESSISSLEWDNIDILTQLSDKLNEATWFEDTVSLTSSTSEDVFFLDTRTSTPVSKRITRSMSASGNISPDPSPIKHKFNRRHRFRQGLRLKTRPKVKYTEGVTEIENSAAISKSKSATNL